MKLIDNVDQSTFLFFSILLLFQLLSDVAHAFLKLLDYAAYVKVELLLLVYRFQCRKNLNFHMIINEVMATLVGT